MIWDKFGYSFFFILLLALWLECSPKAQETRVQPQVASYQRHKEMVLDAALLNTQHCKVWIKGKVEQSMERNSALPYTSMKKGAFWSPLTTTMVANLCILSSSSSSSKSTITLYKSFRLYPVSTQSWWNDFTSQLTLVGVHRRTLLMSSFLLHQPYPPCLARLT